jgi:hypothetical protein
MKMTRANPVISKQQDQEALIKDFRAAAHRHLHKWVDQQSGMFTSKKLYVGDRSASLGILKKTVDGSRLRQAGHDPCRHNGGKRVTWLFFSFMP